MKFTSNIDIQRLAGISTILGIDLTEQRAHVVELQKHGSLLNRFRATFRPLLSFTCDFSPNSSVAERAAILKRALAAHQVKTKFAVSGIQSIGVKVVTATIPAGTSNLDEWIREHRDKLLKLPVSAGQIIHAFEIIERSDSGIVVEITFLKSSDVELHRSFFEEVGLTLVSLAAGTRDAFSAFLLGGEGLANKDLTLIHVGDSVVSSADLIQGKRKAASYTRTDAGKVLPAVMEELRGAASRAPEDTIIAGQIEDAISSKYSVLKPFGLDSRWTLAAGLALKGFFPELSPADSLSQNEREKADASLYRSLLQRTVLACGLVLMVLLLLQLVASFYLESRMDSVDEKLLALGPNYTDVLALESQIRQLEDQLEGRELSFGRSETARTLHEVAQLTPQGVWLYRLRQDRKENEPRTLALYGYTGGNDAIADFVKNLNTTFSEAELVRSGTPLRSESLVPASRRSAPLITFQINVRMRD
jgi:hypothetical protein